LLSGKPFKTIENLKVSIKGETTASARYAVFVRKARLDGKITIANLFVAASISEAIHAANHKKVLESLDEKIESFVPQFEVQTTEENLQSAIDGESYEVNSMYPIFISDARDENVAKAKESFTWSFNTEKKHQGFYTKCLDALKNKTENTLPSGYVVCPTCGNTFEKKAVDTRCSFCQTRKGKFIDI
jgi:rubrerythrin